MFLCFSISPKTQAGEEYNQTVSESVYRHQNEVDFNLEKLIGLINDNNRKFRRIFYSRLEYELGQNHISKSPYDEVNNTIEQCELSIDQFLGVDFPKSKRMAIANAQREMLTEKNILDTSNPRVDKEVYADRMSFYFERFLEETASILTDEEFEALFKISKGEIGTAFQSIIYKSN
ncbi:hypothetical protein L6261_04260 [Candidatus Parcubacteria bacterium]|nr:hypothetical protein [Candidatus Parcubacteria bacterium]